MLIARCAIPIRRTEYLLKLHGAEIGEEHSGKGRTDPSRVPADLLEEVFDLNMQLEEMRANQKMGEDDPALKQDLTAAKKKFDGLLDDVDRDLRAQGKAWDDGDEAARAAAQKTMIALLDRRRYLDNLVRDRHGDSGSLTKVHGGRTCSRHRSWNHQLTRRLHAGRQARGHSRRRRLQSGSIGRGA